MTIPAFDIALRFEHGGDRLQTLFGEAARAAGVKRGERADGVVVYSAPEPLPFMDWEPEAWVDGDAVTLVSRGAFLSGAGAKLADDATFRAALAQVGDKGNGLSYIGPRLAERARRVLELNPDLPLEQRQAVERVLQLLPAPGESVVFLRQNLPDGVLFRSRSQASQKQNLVLANPGVIMTTGLVAAMAIPAFQKVRATSQEKAVLNNLRQLSAASEQYFLENGKASCTYADLVGPGRDKYIRQMTPVAGEDYTAMTFRSDEPHLSVVLADGRVVEYTRR